MTSRRCLRTKTSGLERATHLTPHQHRAEDDLQPVEEVVADDDDRGAAGRPALTRTDRLDARGRRRQQTYDREGV